MWKRRLHNAAKAVSEIVDRFRKAIDNNLYICGVFIDFFESFRHSESPNIVDKTREIWNKESSLRIVHELA